MDNLTNIFRGQSSILPLIQMMHLTHGINYFHQVIDKHAPYHERRIKYRMKPEWLDDKIIKSMKMRDRYKKRRDLVNYKRWRNLVVKKE